jgi:hypothetical protein
VADCRFARTATVPTLEQAGYIVGRTNGWAEPSADGLTIEFREADAESLPFADGAFDAVVSTFGVMSTPPPGPAAGERLDFRFRVCPYVVVRFSCRACPQIGRYRLALPAERLGAEAPLVGVLEPISSTGLRNKEKHSGHRCQRQPTRIPPMPRERGPDCSRPPR